MSLARKWLAAPHLILAVMLTGAVMGVFGLFRMPVNLFPDSERPQAAVVTVWPGASASDVEAELTRIVETELASLEQLRQVTSTSRDETSVVTAEFSYERDLDTVATDVAAALDRVEGQLPAGIRTPMVFKISSATPAVMTLALSPKPGKHLDLSMVRQVAENEIRDRLLRLPEVARVEVFGGHRPIALVEPDPIRLAAHGLSVEAVAEAITGRARNQPYGRLEGFHSDDLLVRLDARSTPSELEDLVVAARGEGLIRLRDVATIGRGEEDPKSIYHANGEPAIAVNIQRASSGNTLNTIEALASVLPELVRSYPAIDFSVPDNQGDLIRLSMSNMNQSLVGAVIATMLILFFFLGDRRVTLLSGVSLPLTFLLTFAAMWMLGMELNLVTFTAIIVAVGMLVDNSVVVIENIVRHAQERNGDPKENAAVATSEVAVAIFGGTMTTVMVLLPVLFIGGFVETILRPFALTLILAILNSYLVAVTVIPLMAPLLLRPARKRRLATVDRLAAKVGEASTKSVAGFASRASQWALTHRKWVLLVAGALFVISARQVPVLGRDLMPPMDTGIVKIEFEAAPNTPIEDVEELLSQIESIVLARGSEILSVSSVVGSEPEVTSVGAGSTVRQGLITVNMVDRFHREASIWKVEEELYQELAALPGMVGLSIYEYGSTPMSSVQASVDVEIAGSDPAVLEELGREVERRLRERVRGITSIQRSWRQDAREMVFEIDPERCARHGMTPESVASQIAGLLRGRPSTELRQPAQRGLPITVRIPERDRSDVERLAGLQVMAPSGPVPISALGTFRPIFRTGLITHRNLARTLDVTATRGLTSLTHLQEEIEKALTGIELGAGYVIHHQGEIKEMWESFGRLSQALLLSLVFLYGTLVPTFRSWTHPITIMAAIPLAAVGSIWALMLAFKSSNMPAFMGIILLGGVAVNTSILLLDVIERERKRGATRTDAVQEAIRQRTRPILMTTASTIVGMLPVALQRAVGLERLSPLAIVSMGGLLLSSLLVLVFVPVVATYLEDGIGRIKRWIPVVSTASPEES